MKEIKIVVINNDYYYFAMDRVIYVYIIFLYILIIKQNKSKNYVQFSGKVENKTINLIHRLCRKTWMHGE